MGLKKEGEDCKGSKKKTKRLKKKTCEEEFSTKNGLLASHRSSEKAILKRGHMLQSHQENSNEEKNSNKQLPILRSVPFQSLA